MVVKTFNILLRLAFVIAFSRRVYYSGNGGVC